MSDLEQANFLLVDGVLRPGALVEVMKDDHAAQVNPLYLGSRWSELHSQGPILIKLEVGGPKVSEWLTDPRKQEDSTLLYSSEPLQIVAHHLKHFLCPPDAFGGSGLLRFADPAVAHFWLSSFYGSELDERLGPIEHWSVGRPIHSWQAPPLRNWQTFSRTGAERPWQADFALLGHPQLAALEQAQRWQLEERFYQWLLNRSPSFFEAMNSEQTSQWMQTTVDSGIAWGLTTERRLMIWAEITIDYGSDFIDQRRSRYQTWLHRDPEHARLSPDFRIRDFDIFRHMHRDFVHES